MPVVRQRISREDFRLSYLIHEVEHLQGVVLLLIAMELSGKTIGSWPVKRSLRSPRYPEFNYFFKLNTLGHQLSPIVNTCTTHL